MNEAIYYDHRGKRTIDLRRDTCPLSKWSDPGCEAAAAIHPSGFPVFLSPDRIAELDEYVAADPYTVEENLDSPFHERRVQCTLDLLVDAVRSRSSGLRILDVACGKGFITARISEALPRAHVYGMDGSLTAIEHAAAHYRGIGFSVADALELPYVSGSFDVVVCNNLWEHVPDPVRLLEGVRRVLRRPGHLVISTPSRYRTENLVRVLRGREVEMLNKHHVTEYSVGQVREQLGHGGFKVVRVHARPVLSGSLKRRVAHRVFRTVFGLFDASHKLEATVFHLARID